jgi:pilus assembly protein CpaB
MQLARVAVLGVALGAGVIAAVLAVNVISGRQPAPAPATTAAAPAPLKSVPVLVTTKDIPLGTTVSEDAVAWQDWPQTGVGGTFLTRTAHPDAVKEVVGAIARATFYAGEPITDNKLIRSDRGFMSAILPAGKRAVATRISADTSAGGFILPNDRVDVIMTRKEESQNGQEGQYRTETILNNVRVLAIDQTVEDVNGEQVVVGQTATLELTPQQAEILTVAQQMSDRLTLALRSIADAETAPLGDDAYHLIGGKSGTVTVVKNGVAKQVPGLQ